jgi:hypothetical protein
MCLSFQHYLPQAREVWAFCFFLRYTTWNILSGSFTSLDVPSHSTFTKGLQEQDTQAECMVCWDKSCTAAVWVWAMRKLVAAHGKALLNSVSNLSKTFVLGHGLALFGGFE